ncbi:metallophosphoesterase [Bradyrhizobium sp.]
MKIFIASDTHWETGGSNDWSIDNRLDFDVAVFAGDIGQPRQAIDWMLRQPALDGKPIAYVLGNHEFYGGVLEDCAAEARDATRGTNIHVLDADQILVVGDTRFLGCTLWTDYRFMARNPVQGLQAGMRINDRLRIRTSAGAEIPDMLYPGKALERHRRERGWLEARLAEPFEGNTVVATHHGVHPNSLHPRYAGDGPVNASFITDLSSTIERFQPMLWIHGHVHDTHIYAIGETQVVCNPRGYPSAGRGCENAGFIPDLVVEIPEWTPTPKMM